MDKEEDALFQIIIDGVVWVAVPFLCIMGVIEETSNMLTARELNLLSLIAVVVFLVAGYFSFFYGKQRFFKWLEYIQSGQSVSGSIAYTFTGDLTSLTRSIISIIAISGLMIILSYLTQQNFSDLFFFVVCGAAGFALGKGIVPEQFLLGNHGLWLTTIGIWRYMSYTNFDLALISPDKNTDQVIAKLHYKSRFKFNSKSRFQSRARFQTITLSHPAISILEKHIPIEFLER